MSQIKKVFSKNKIKKSISTLKIDLTIVGVFLKKVISSLPVHEIFNARQLSNLSISFVISFIPAFSWMQSPIAHANVQAEIIENQNQVKANVNSIVLAETIKEPEHLPEEKPVEPTPTAPVATPTQAPQQIIQTPTPVQIKKVVPTVAQKAAPLQPVQNTNKMFIWPVAGNLGEVSRGLQPGHTGIDIWSNASPFVVAMAPGTVTSTGWENGGGGYVVRVKFDNGYLGLYAHTVGNFQVSPGQHVVSGQALATMGRTGNATGVHLHIELYDPAGHLLNGLAYFSK